LDKLNTTSKKGGIYMQHNNLRSEFGVLKGKPEDNPKQIVNSLHYLREPHGIQEGIRKDKKIKMNRKLNN
jgi:hypothetical protein